MSKIYQIEDGAIFIADAHENSNRQEFLKFLKMIYDGQIKTKQLFLVGDIFDFLSGYTKYSCKFYDQHISLINLIAKKIDVFYIEGNHDYNLEKIFEDVRIFTIKSQPVSFNLKLSFGSEIYIKDKKINPKFLKTLSNENFKEVKIAHGDNFLPLVSRYALLFLRLKWFLVFMNFLDIIFKYKISKVLLKKLSNKKLDYKIPNFKKFIYSKFCKYDADIVVEGHYHQGEGFELNDGFYINLPSFACDQSYFVVKYFNNKIQFAQESLKGH